MQSDSRYFSGRVLFAYEVAPGQVMWCEIEPDSSSFDNTIRIERDVEEVRSFEHLHPLAFVPTGPLRVRITIDGFLVTQTARSGGLRPEQPGISPPPSGVIPSDESGQIEGPPTHSA